MNAKLLSGASAVVIAICVGVDVPCARAAEAAATQPSAVSVQEVIVTAERRSQKLETVPVSVSAFTAEQRSLMGIKTVQDLTDYTPGLAYTTVDNRPYIRGIGRNTDNLAVESGVAVYVDNIYFGANGSTILQNSTLFTDQIEVLRGPQSTLYGRNADGGAINYISVRPPNHFEAELRAGYANYNKYFVEGATGGPITDTLKFRIGANYTQQNDGYFKNLNGASEGGDVAQGGRGRSEHAEFQIQWTPNDKFDWWVKAATSDYDVDFHTGALIGPYDTREFPSPLYPSPNYGFCAIPGGSVNPGCGPSQGNVDTIVPGSVVTLPNTQPTNPALTNVRTFDADFKSHSVQDQNIVLATQMTYHGSGFDVKYLGGFQRFLYDLTSPYVNGPGISSSIQSYQLQGPPGLGNLTINSAHDLFTFIENEYFFSHELNISSTTNGPVQWIFGLYYYHEHYKQPIDLVDPAQAQIGSPLYLNFATGAVTPAPPNPTRGVFEENTNLTEDSYAAFGQVDWKITNTIKLTGGIRYTRDHKYGGESNRTILFANDQLGLGVNTFGAGTPAFDFSACPASPPPPYPGAGACSIDPVNGGAVRSLNAWWDAVTGTADLSWTPDPDTLAYAKYSRGYKTGGFNSGFLAAFPETLPETVDAYEAGIKKVVGRHLQVNLAGFYYNYYNDQQPLGALVSGVLVTEIINIPTVHTYGAELEATWAPTRDLSFNLSYAYLNSTIASMVGSNGKLLCVQDTNDPFAIEPGANINSCGTAGLQNLTGARLPETPHNKISLNGLYKINFEPGSLALSASFIWKDQQFDSVFNRFYDSAPSYTQVNIRATWSDIKNRYNIILFCNNVFNTLGYDGTAGLLVSAPGPGQVVNPGYTYTAPRTYGVELQVRLP
jgi:iron complex outermembrane receptor protein